MVAKPAILSRRVRGMVTVTSMECVVVKQGTVYE